VAGDQVVIRLEERVRAVETLHEEVLDRLDRLEDRLERLYLWIIGTAGSVAVAILILLLQVVTRK
jgi:hypothetical protein